MTRMKRDDSSIVVCVERLVYAAPVLSGTAKIIEAVYMMCETLHFSGLLLRCPAADIYSLDVALFVLWHL